VPAFRWFNKYLQKDTATLIDEAAVKRFEPKELKVFTELPEDQLNSTIHETFVPAAPAPKVPESKDQWAAMRDDWRAALLEKSFRAWPREAEPLNVREAFASQRDGMRLRACDFTSQGPVRLRLYLLERAGLEKPARLTLQVLDQSGWVKFLAAMRPAFEQELKGEALPAADLAALAGLRDQLGASPCVLACVAPRGVGPTVWDQSEKKQIQIRRRFMLLGQTLDGMQVWDVRRAIEALRSLDNLKTAPLTIQAAGVMAGIALYASLFEPAVAQLELENLPATHREGPIFLNVSRYLEMPQAVAMAAERSHVSIVEDKPGAWEYPRAVAKQLGWGGKQIQLVGSSEP
jgi:hypothetical protein